MRNKTWAASIIIFTAALLILTSPFPANSASSQHTEQENSSLTMPIEYINYTIVSINNRLWAKIDGTYPIYLQGDLPQSLQMVYPTPPETTNITLKLNDQILSYTNYTDIYPTALHHTAIGDWKMVSSEIDVNSEAFTLKIHYEHPLQIVNGSSLFLYDLNISPYLSPVSNSSIAYFTIRMETNTSIISAFTTETDTKWNPINYTLSKEDEVEVVSIVMYSQYEHLLGDLVVIFSDEQIPEYPFWALTMLIVGLSTTAIILAKIKHRYKYRRVEENVYS